MRSNYEAARAEQIEIVRDLSRGTAQLCGNNFKLAWEGIFKFKPAVALVEHTGCALRTAEAELSGEVQPSPQSLLALLTLCTPPRRKRPRNGNGGGA